MTVANYTNVIPAEAGIYPSLKWSQTYRLGWMPAYAGMTVGVETTVDNIEQSAASSRHPHLKCFDSLSPCAW